MKADVVKRVVHGGRMAWLKGGVAVFFWVLGLAGCTTTIRPPPDPAEPVTVYLVDHGRTPSLVVPSATGELVRYAYGDWRYYALSDRDLLTGLVALCWPTQAALGRRALAGPASEATVHAQVRVRVDHVYPIIVARESAYRLQAELDELYRSRLHTQVFDPAAGLAFVHHPASYTMFHNSNHVAADWLGRLGCEVRGPTLLSNWRVVPVR